MRFVFLGALLATVLATAARAELNTFTYIDADANGAGSFDGDITGVNAVTLLDTNAAGGDLWNGGDQFSYLHDSNKVTGDWSATVRVVSQTEATDGRWGKGGIHARNSLDPNAGQAMAQVAAGNGSQVAAPSSGADHSPVPVRLAGRTQNNGEGGFERPVFNSTGGEIPNNVFPESDDVPALANTAWLSLHYNAAKKAFVAGYADDVGGAPGEWGYSLGANDIPAAADSPGWYVGLGYSTHNSIEIEEHGITFDNWSRTSELTIPNDLFFAGTNNVGGANALGDITLNGTPADVVRGPDELVAGGLAQTWFDGAMRQAQGGAQLFLDAIADPIAAGRPQLADTFVDQNTWWSGSNNPVTIGGKTFPDYPAGLAGTRFDGSGDEDNYGVRLTGEVFISQNGAYLVRDGVDDFTVLMMDLNGDGELASVDDIIDSLDNPFDEVIIHDDDWAAWDGGSQPNTGIADFENIPAGGEFRRIELWASEQGGGDAGTLYIAHEDDPDIDFDAWDAEDALPAGQRDLYIVKNDQMQAVVPGPILSGSLEAALDQAIIYKLEVNSELLDADHIVVDDPGGAVVTKLDVGGATVEVVAQGDLKAGDEFVLFGADELVGLDSLNLVFDDASQWDISGLSVDGPFGHRIRYVGAGVSLDCNGDGAVDATDLACGNAAGTTEQLLSNLGLVAGDLDGQDGVSFADFLVLSANFGQSSNDYTLGDIDGNGEIAFADFLVLSANFGQGVAAAAVPEPASACLIAMAFAFLGLVRRRS